jgi:alpha-glutamyl/putrescinyl thymine pyrophosphorylase clade 1
MTLSADPMTSMDHREGLFESSPVRNEIHPPVPPARPITVAGRRLHPTAVFDTYWRFAAARQEVYEARLRSAPGPWTTDPILRHHRFTNCYRASDRVSQYLIAHVSYEGGQDPSEVFFRTLLFKVFNKISTWQLLSAELEEITWAAYDFRRYNAILSQAFAQGQTLYSAAYVVPPPALGEDRKHSNHLRLIEMMMSSDISGRIGNADSMQAAFLALREYPAMGNFLAYQYLIDLNYSAVLSFDEGEFVVPGPGARDGIRKCFGVAATGIESEIIRYMADHQAEHFSRLGLAFNGLRGRPLQLIDCQNLFCEVDKYARVAHPDVNGHSGRTRIKQRFQAIADPIPAWFPPKWGINTHSASPSLPAIAAISDPSTRPATDWLW